MGISRLKTSEARQENSTEVNACKPTGLAIAVTSGFN